MSENTKKIDNTTEAVEEKKVTKKAPSFVVTVESNPSFCGIDAGGVQFANGKAVITDVRMANWFKEHDGYKVDNA